MVASLPGPTAFSHSIGAAISGNNPGAYLGVVALGLAWPSVTITRSLGSTRWFMAQDRVPTQYAATLLRMAAQRGVDYQPILEAAGIDFDPLSDTPDKPRDVTAMQYSRIYGQVLSIIQDESFGLGEGPRMRPGAFRMLCYCIIPCRNLGRAIQRAAEFYRVDRKSTRLNSSHSQQSRMPSSA